MFDNYNTGPKLSGNMIRRYLSKLGVDISEGVRVVGVGIIMYIYIYIYKRHGSQNFSTPARRMVYGLR